MRKRKRRKEKNDSEIDMVDNRRKIQEKTKRKTAYGSVLEREWDDGEQRRKRRETKREQVTSRDQTQEVMKMP